MGCATHHLHAVLTLPDNDSDYSGRWREIKKRFSKSLPKTEFLTQTRKRKNERGVWQRRFWSIQLGMIMIIGIMLTTCILTL